MQSNRLLRFSQIYKRPQSASLLAQIPARNGVPPVARQVFEAFLSLDSEQPDLAFVAPPEAPAYEFQSGTVLSLLRELLDKFEHEQLALE